MQPVRCAILAAVGLASAVSMSSVQGISIAEPDYDRWNYPFSPGGATTTASVFSDGGFQPFFDLRDGQFLNTYVTSDDIAPGQGAGNYVITGAVVRATIANANGYIVGGTGGASPLELFATNFRNGYDALSYGENAPFGPSQFTPGTRNAFAADAAGTDVSNNASAIALALGTISGKSTGQAVANGDVVEFSLNVSDPSVQSLLANGLNGGVLSFSITCLEVATDTGGGTYPRFATRENATYSGVSLDLTVIPGPGALGVMGIAGVGMLRRKR